MPENPVVPPSRPSRRSVLNAAAVFGVSVAGVSGLLAGCSTEVKTKNGGTVDSNGKPVGGSPGASAAPADARTGTAAKTLFVAGFQWGPPTSFNPLGNTSAWPCAANQSQFIYETLVRFNLLDGSLAPGLSTGLKDSGPTEITVPMQTDAKWQDGKPVTAEDVVYTFMLGKTHPEISYASFWDYVASVTATDPATVKVTLKKSPLNADMVRNYLATTYIVPKHVWTAVEAKKKPIGDDPNTSPVGSGPYQVDNYNQQQVALKKFPGYWGKTVFGDPAPTAIVHPIFKGNDAGDLALQSGDVDVSQQFTPQVWLMWEKQKKPVSTWLKKKPYDIPGSIPMLVLNTKKKGLDNPQVRRAIAYSINYPQIAATAMSEYSAPANSSVILPTGSEQKFFDADAVAKNGWKFDPDQAKKILEQDLKAKKGGDGIYVLPDGTRLGPWQVITPTGWSDWQSALTIVASNAKTVGIDISTNFPQAPQVTTAVQNGNFDLACWYVAGVSVASPWQRFRDVLDDRGVPPVGKPAFYNYGRFADPAVRGLLDQAAAASSDAEKKKALSALDAIFMKNVPMIPLMYRPLEFFEFNESTWTNFPTATNDYAPPMWQGAGIEWLFKIKSTTA